MEEMMKKVLSLLLVLAGITGLIAETGYPPQRLLCYSDDSTIHLNWDPPSDTQWLTGYKVYRNNTLLSSCSYQQTYFEDTTFEINSSYSYKISAIYINPDSESVPCDTVNIIPAYDPSNNPIGLTYNQVKRDVKLFWNTSENYFYGDFFDNVTIENRWTLTDADGDGHPWYISKEAPSIDNHYMKSNGVINNQNLNPKNWLITPRLHISDSSAGYYFRVKATNSTLKILYSYSNNDPANFVLVDSINVTGNEWIEYSRSFSSNEDSLKYIAFLHEGTNTSDIIIDNFSLMIITTQNQDRSLVGFNIYKNGVLENDSIISPENKTYTMNNLANGDYTFEVKAVNEYGLQGSSTKSISISDPIFNTTYPYNLDFESGGIPSGWELFNNDYLLNNWYINDIPGIAHTGTNYLATYSSYYEEMIGLHNLNPDDYFISPIMDIPTTYHSLMLRYYVRSLGNNQTANYQLVIYNPPYGINNIQTAVDDTVGADGWELREFNLSYFLNAPVAVGWRFNNSHEQGMGLDDISFYLVNPTDKPELALIETKLLNNYPNPFNPSTTINYSLKDKARITIEIYNVKGQKVHDLLNETKSAGNHQISWNGLDNQNKACASGVYFCRMNVSGQSQLMKMLLVK